MEQVLCYFPDPGDPVCAAVRRTALLLKIRLRTAGPEQTGQTVGLLLGRKGFVEQAGEAPAVTDPILIMDALTSSRMDDVLRALAKAKVSRSVFKAVATATNVDWTLHELWEELKKEREALERGETSVHTA